MLVWMVDDNRVFSVVKWSNVFSFSQCLVLITLFFLGLVKYFPNGTKTHTHTHNHISHTLYFFPSVVWASTIHFDAKYHRELWTRGSVATGPRARLWTCIPQRLRSNHTCSFNDSVFCLFTSVHLNLVHLRLRFKWDFLPYSAEETRLSQ